MKKNNRTDEQMEVLVIDDEEGIREGIRRVLVKRGFQVETAEGGQAAMELLENKVYDLALVDLKMPNIDGFKVTEYINQRYAEKTVVVIVSALATVEAAVEVSRHGAFDFLVKPFTPQDLLQVVERAVKQRKLLQERERFLFQLNNERNLSRQMINAMQEGVLIMNVNRKPVLMNPKAEFFLGVRYNEELEIGDLGLGQEVETAVGKVLAGQEGEDQIRLAGLAMGELMVQVHLSPYVRDGSTIGVLIIISDYTDEWKAEQDKNRFISLVAHELKGPLAAIISYIELILDGMFDDKIEEIHKIMKRSKVRGEALLDLIGDLTYLNKRDAGHVEKTIERLDLKDIIEAQLEFLSVQAERKAVALKVEAEDDDVMVMADRGDLDRIFMNLISNGIKYNRDGGSLTVRLYTDKWQDASQDASQDAGQDAVVVEVADTGIGMTEEEQANLFQEFYRVRNSETSGIVGTGLGLATVKRVLSSYNGRISCSSVPKKGTTFTVIFPRDLSS
jgi:two-component system phosphate regulon sensor histidine kinase PhoR